MTEPVVDHIIPLTQGGTNALSNLRIIGADCNRERIGGRGRAKL